VCDTIAGVPDVDFSLLDVPRQAPVGDAQAFLRTAMAWHFGEQTGSAFWLRAAKDLPFDPVTDVNTFEDVRRFTTLVKALGSVPVEDLVPRGYGSPPPPTYYTAPGVPHDGYLADFLMRCKGFARNQPRRRGSTTS
jgi:hypothetical protein